MPFLTLFHFIRSLGLKEVELGGFIDEEPSRTFTSCKRKKTKATPNIEMHSFLLHLHRLLGQKFFFFFLVLFSYGKTATMAAFMKIVVFSFCFFVFLFSGGLYFFWCVQLEDCTVKEVKLKSFKSHYVSSVIFAFCLILDNHLLNVSKRFS